MIVGIVGAILLCGALVGYGVVSKWNKQNTSQLKKGQKAEIKQKVKKMRVAAHSMLGVAIVLVLISLLLNAAGKYDLETLNYKARIEVRNDRDYGAGHTEMPVQYEMKFPTSGTHSPHDLKFGFYEDKPSMEELVHNLEHGDILIYYRPDASSAIKDAVEYLSHFTKAGAGVLAVPSADIPEGKEIILNAWTKTLELATYDEQQAGTFIYEYINEGPEKIPANVRRGGGTM
ncbi:DUF3105 domain-containing protein [Cohnella cholangitidis]|uniref:DUF3105 domain-containing protein n=1 Tax=Cohnella cholangitidis TaxID=2598458 RepID=A0A7G5BSH0_9BACL|nr:DUF3105 domain-containing protein [Cohnella cholangitidis]QMV39904.1 DUF3105 domain-containing protein [Cohnella cholangitidis]